MHIVKAVFSLYLPFYGVMAVPLTLYFPQYLIWFPLPHTPIPTIRPVRPLLLLRCGHTLLIADLFSRRAGTRPPRYAPSLPSSLPLPSVTIAWNPALFLSASSKTFSSLPFNTCQFEVLLDHFFHTGSSSESP